MTRPVVALVAAGCIASMHASAADDMVRVPAGRYVMGSTDGASDERPAHELHVAAFEIDRYPVTNAEFAAFLTRTGAMRERWYDFDDPDARIHSAGSAWKADAGYERHPAVEVTWAGARAYCAALGKRLPTEAEWEKAARGSDGRRYPWGNALPDATRAQFGMGFNHTAPVDAHPAGAGPYGTLDMAGNAWEWVSTLYRPYPYRGDDGREDPHAGGARGTRGGGHDSSAEEITTTQRGRNLSRSPRSGHHNIGFRCAR
ncbi:MAG: formylglycine-generating enzyme family protein [Rhodospirillaceae bacterium]